ncbi:hypothetical protein VNI00_017095 [Paramarasmius palmivorus]|uniref:Uncharacterized protein n=1 Tax=Paramarasmius palmivorus TaxID=297713 RepID=A0AAW0B915_9AGAR
MRPYSSQDPIHNMRKVENALNKSTARIPRLSQHFDSVVVRLLKWESANPLTCNPVSPLSKPFKVFQPLQHKAEIFTEQILQQKGSTSEYDKALSVRANQLPLYG